MFFILITQFNKLKIFRKKINFHTLVSFKFKNNFEILINDNGWTFQI